MCAFDTTWEEVYQKTGFGGGYPDTNLVRFVARNLYSKDRKSTRILEVGCGIGANLWYFAREGFDTYGLDGSKTAIEKCSERLKQQNYSCKLVVGDACATDLPHGYFDAVVDVECIYANRISDIRRILSEIYRVLKTDGLFYSMMFGVKTTGYGLGKELEPNTFADIKSRAFAGRGIAHFFTEEEIRCLLEQAGFRDIEINWVLRTEKQQQETIHEFLCQAKK